MVDYMICLNCEREIYHGDICFTVDDMFSPKLLNDIISENGAVFCSEDCVDKYIDGRQD